MNKIVVASFSAIVISMLVQSDALAGDKMTVCNLINMELGVRTRPELDNIYLVGKLVNGEIVTTTETIRYDTSGRAFRLLDNGYWVSNRYLCSKTINSEQSPSNQRLEIVPTSQAGNYWVYQKPSNLTEDQMRTAGAAYYSSPQACSMHYSLCTTLGGVWLSSQRSLVIQFPQDVPVNLQPLPTGISPSLPKSDTELYLGFYRECIDRTMYRTLSAFDRATAVNGYNMGYKYGQKPSNLSDAQMESAGLNWDWTFQSWIGSQPQIKIPIMESVQASQQCKAELGNIRP